MISYKTLYGTVSSIAGGVTEYNPPNLDNTSKNLWNDNFNMMEQIFCHIVPKILEFI